MAHSKLYIQLMNSREWRELRTQVIREHPICQRCEAMGRVTASRCVHHIVPVESGRTEAECRELAMRRSNCQALCYQCHADIHRAEHSHSRDVILERTNQRLAAWADSMQRRMAGPPKPEPPD